MRTNDLGTTALVRLGSASASPSLMAAYFSAGHREVSNNDPGEDTLS